MNRSQEGISSSTARWEIPAFHGKHIYELEFVHYHVWLPEGKDVKSCFLLGNAVIELVWNMIMGYPLGDSFFVRAEILFAHVHDNFAKGSRGNDQQIWGAVTPDLSMLASIDLCNQIDAFTHQFASENEAVKNIRKFRFQIDSKKKTTHQNRSKNIKIMPVEYYSKDRSTWSISFAKMDHDLHPWRCRLAWQDEVRRRMWWLWGDCAMNQWRWEGYLFIGGWITVNDDWWWFNDGLMIVGGGWWWFSDGLWTVADGLMVGDAGLTMFSWWFNACWWWVTMVFHDGEIMVTLMV